MPPKSPDNRSLWQIAVQIAAITILVLVIAFLWQNIDTNLQRQGIRRGFDFLGNSAQFEIGEKPISY